MIKSKLKHKNWCRSGRLPGESIVVSNVNVIDDGSENQFPVEAVMVPNPIGGDSDGGQSQLPEKRQLFIKWYN